MAPEHYRVCRRECDGTHWCHAAGAENWDSDDA